MRKELGNKVSAGGHSPRSLMRRVGRVALWGAVCVLLLRGLASVLSGPTEVTPSRSGASGSEPAAAAFAVRFARAYLEDPSPEALTPFLAAGANVGTGRPPSARGAEVAQAEVVRSAEVGDERAVVTVACELRDSRALYLAVPIVRFRAGEVAALGAPSIVAVPAVVGADPERPQPLAGPDAPAIQSLVEKFLPAYLTAKQASDLSYLLAPGAEVIPLAGSLELLGAPRVTQLGSEEGPRRSVVASVSAREPVSGATYPLAYRLEVVRRGRWYVSDVQGALP